MKLKKKRVEKFERLPDEAGAFYDAIEEFKPRSYIKLENGIRNFLNYSHKNIDEDQPPISAEMLVAPWGVGKTTTYDKMIKKLLQEKDFPGFSVKITAQEISHTYDNFLNSKEFNALKNDADRFILILSNLLIDKIEFSKEFPDLHVLNNNKDEIEQFFMKIQEKCDFFLIFIDEFEEVIKNENNIIVFILKSLKALLNGTSNIINKDSNSELNHFLSFLIACTDAAFYEISRHDKLKYEYGAMKRRIRDRHISGISLSESIDYLYKLNKFAYNGKHVESFVNFGASFNVVARMAMKNAGYMKSFFWEIMNAAVDLDSKNMIIQIDGELIIETARKFTLQYMEADRKSISEEVYLNWLNKFKRKPIIRNLINIFLGEIKVFSLEEIADRFENEISKSDILKSIRELNSYINSIHSNINKAIIQIDLFKDEITAADIENTLNYTDNSVELNENGEQIIRFSEGDVLFSQFLEPISYYEIDDTGNLKEIYFFSRDKPILQEIFPYLDSETINILKLYFKDHLNPQINDNYIINPNLFNIVFPLPIPLEYNLIDNKNINVAIWTEISRIKKSEIFQNRICDIISNFLVLKKFILNSDDPKNISKIRKINSIKYYAEVYDKNRFIILQNYKVSNISNNPLNIMFWREIGDYDYTVMNDIISNIALFQKNEMRNIHLVILLSQTKISEELINNLNENIEYSILKQLTLSQFDITKYAFLERVKDMKEEDYDVDLFSSALENLISPFKLIIDSAISQIDEKGLNIRLNKYMSPLSYIPQLLKYILYDFKNNFNNWKSVELKKPFINVNPIGLSPRYSSSIDDWGQKKLRSNIEDFLQINDYVKIKDNSLKISMPLIEEKVLQLIKDFSKKSIIFNVNDIKLFLFETTDSPSLFEEVFLNDLENRGIISVSKDKFVSLVERNDELLKLMYKEIKEKIKTLRVKDKNFYHIFTFKKQGYSLIFVQDFLDTLELMIDFSADINEDLTLMKQYLFHRIFTVFDGILSQIFLPLDIEISNFKNKFRLEKNSKFDASYINLKLQEFGFKNINIEEISELKDLEEVFEDSFTRIEQSVNRGELRKKASQYYKDHIDEVNSSNQKFSYIVLQKQKLEKQFKSPYLNIIYHDMLGKKEQVLESQVIQKLNNIRESIKEIINNYSTIKGSIAERPYNGKLAPLIFEKIKKLSDFKFFETERKAASLAEINNVLQKLKSEINEKIVKINFLLKRKRSANQMNLLDQINLAEISIESSKIDIQNIVKYLLEKEIIEKEENIEGFSTIKETFDISKYFEKINNCDNLEDLQQIANNVSTVLISRTDTFKNINERIKLSTVKYFSDWRNINSLKRIFKSLKYGNYAKTCEKYLNQIKRFYLEDQDIPFISICNDILSLQARIKEGYQRSLKEKLTERQQEIFLELYDDFNKDGLFCQTDLENIAKKFKLNSEEISNLVKDLINNDLLEEIYRFK